jgi:hypothetical protein
MHGLQDHSIDVEAYEALRRRKGKGDSFSDVIRRHFDRGTTGSELDWEELAISVHVACELFAAAEMATRSVPAFE